MFFESLSFLQFLTVFGGIAAVSVALYLLDRSRRKVVVSTLRFWTTADGMPESNGQAFSIAPDGTVWVRHGATTSRANASFLLGTALSAQRAERSSPTDSGSTISATDA